MLKSFVEKKHCNFVDSCKDWKDALEKCCQPIVADGTVDGTYASQVISSVEKYGPYIVLAPGIAMPHTQENASGVTKTTISFMKVKEPVIFDEKDPDSYAKLFFTLASCNPDEHLANMQSLMEILMNEELVAELMEVENEEGLLKLAEKYSA